MQANFTTNQSCKIVLILIWKILGMKHNSDIKYLPYDVLIDPIIMKNLF